MINIIVFFHLFAFFPNGSAYITYEQRNKDYSFVINKNEKISRKQIKDGYVEQFIIKDIKDTLKSYVITVSKLLVPSKDFTENTLLSEEYKQGLIQNCNCNVIDVQKKEYTNFSGVVYKIKAKSSNKSVLGYTVATLKNGSLYNISFMSSEALFSAFEPEFEILLTSMKINK